MDRPVKPKTSTFDKLSLVDKTLINQLLVLCGDYYNEVSSPPQKGSHKNLQAVDECKLRILLVSLRVGERLWYPRGNPGLTDSINMPRVSLKNGKKR